jgi:hypothetical protein
VRVNVFPDGWQPHAPPPTPTGYTADTFELPQHQVRVTSLLNPHPHDSRIRFDEAPHLYYVDGVVCSRSCTALCHQFCNEFNSTDAIARMRRSRNWPRLEYTRSDPAAWAGLPFWGPLEERVEQLRDARGSTAPGKYAQWVDAVAMSDDEIETAWRLNKEEACARGTWFHLQCELWLNRDGCHLDWAEMSLFLQYVRNWLEPAGIRVYRTEWEIFSADHDLAGSVDFVGVHTTGEHAGKLFLADWKRSKGLRGKKHHPFGEKLKPPLQMLPDSALCHYAIQLNVYKWILEHNYGVQVFGMHVVCCHTDNGAEPFVYECPEWGPVVDYLMARQQLEATDKVLARQSPLSADEEDIWQAEAAGRMMECRDRLAAWTPE